MKILGKLRAVFAVGAIAILCSTAMATTYSALTSLDTQVAKAANTPYAITMTGESSKSFKIEGSNLTILCGGDYYFNAALQVGSNGNATGDVYTWVRLNGKDVPDSNAVQSVPSPKFTAVLVSQGGMTLKAGDVLEFMYAGTSPGLGIIAWTPANMPAVPSIIFSIFQI